MDKIPLLVDGRGGVSKWDWLRVSLNLSGCLLQVGAGFIPMELGVGRRIGDTLYTVKAQPAGVAFSIWGVIFLACIGYGIYQSMPGNRSSTLLRSIGFYTATAFYATILWELIAILAAPADDDQRGYIAYEWILSFILFTGIALPLNYTLYLLERDGNGSNNGSSNNKSLEIMLVVFPVSVFAAWTTVASFLNWAGALCASGVQNFSVGNASEGGSVAFVTCVGLLILALVFASKGNVPYGCVFVWAFSWIAQVNFASGFRQVGITATVFAVFFVAATLGARGWWWWWSQRAEAGAEATNIALARESAKSEL